MTHTKKEKLLWDGYSYDQERAWRKERERLTQCWKVRKDGDTAKTQEILPLGQQTLKRV